MNVVVSRVVLTHLAIETRWSVGGVDHTKCDVLVSVNANVATLASIYSFFSPLKTEILYLLHTRAG